MGVVAGILLAPASGKETRRKIESKAEDVADQVRASMTRIHDGAKEMIGAGRERLSSTPSIESALNRMDVRAGNR